MTADSPPERVTLYWDSHRNYAWQVPTYGVLDGVPTFVYVRETAPTKSGVHDLMNELLQGTQVPLFHLRLAAHAEITRLTAALAERDKLLDELIGWSEDGMIEHRLGPIIDKAAALRGRANG